jgi:hypothetical protein
MVKLAGTRQPGKPSQRAEMLHVYKSLVVISTAPLSPPCHTMREEQQHSCPSCTARGRDSSRCICLLATPGLGLTSSASCW